jgi:hypothetical protein
LAVLALALLAAFLVVNLLGGSDDRGGGSAGHDHARPGDGSPVAVAAAERPLGPVRIARSGGREARLRVFGDIPRGARLPDGAVPAATPLRLTFSVDAPADALRGARLAAVSVAGDGAPGAPVELDRRAAFLLNTRTGDLVLPSGAVAAGTHAHGGGPADPGAGLAALSPGGGFAWAAQLPPGAGRSVAQGAGRFLAVPYPEAGRVEIVDLLRRARAGSVRVGGRLGAAAFTRNGARLWVVDEEAGELVGIDPVSRSIATRIPVGAGRASLAVDAAGRRGVVATRRDAVLVDLAAGRRLAAAPLPAAPVAAAAAPGGAFVVAHADGRLSVLAAEGDALRTRRVLRTGGDAAGTRTVGLAPDGHTAVVLNEGEDGLVLVDVRRARLLRRVDARAPRDLRFAAHFALVRSAAGPQVTWVDLRTPSRSNVIETGPGSGLFPGLEAGETLVPTADGPVYRLHVMQGRPMVMDEIANTVGADVAVVAAGALHATGAGTLEQRTVLDRPGSYRLELRLASGEAFRFDLRALVPQTGARVRPDRARLDARVDVPVRVRFALRGAAPREAHVLAYGGRLGALRQVRAPAARAADGRYEATVRFPVPGRFRVVLLSEEAGLVPDRASATVVRVRPASG